MDDTLNNVVHMEVISEQPKEEPKQDKSDYTMVFAWWPQKTPAGTWVWLSNYMKRG